jgi:hypothetical protein
MLFGTERYCDVDESGSCTEGVAKLKLEDCGSDGAADTWKFVGNWDVDQLSREYDCCDDEVSKPA